VSFIYFILFLSQKFTLIFRYKSIFISTDIFPITYFTLKIHISNALASFFGEKKQLLFLDYVFFASCTIRGEYVLYIFPCSRARNQEFEILFDEVIAVDNLFEFLVRQIGVLRFVSFSSYRKNYTFLSFFWLLFVDLCFLCLWQYTDRKTAEFFS
jgi:hypothetical protein